MFKLGAVKRIQLFTLSLCWSPSAHVVSEDRNNESIVKAEAQCFTDMLSSQPQRVNKGKWSMQIHKIMPYKWEETGHILYQWTCAGVTYSMSR